MSRTTKKEKPEGYEYWSRRPYNRCGQLPGTFSKHRTHKAERARNKRECKGEEE